MANSYLPIIVLEIGPTENVFRAFLLIHLLSELMFSWPDISDIGYIGYIRYMTYKIWDISDTGYIGYRTRCISFSSVTSQAADFFFGGGYIGCNIVPLLPFFLPIDHWPTPLLLSC